MVIKLYGDAALQIMLIVTAMYGWHKWQRISKKNGKEIVFQLDAKGRLTTIVLSAILSLIIAIILAKFTNDSLPYCDGIITGFSITGQALL